MANMKGTRYLLRPHDMPEQEFEKKKKEYTQKGLKVIILSEGEKNIHEGLKSVLLNHSS